jgi:hypothetical protein
MNIWQIPKYLPYLQPKLTDKIINEAEQKIGFKLPKEYLDLLKIQNGGYIRYTLKDTPHSEISGIGPYFPSLTEFDWLEEFDFLSFEVKSLFPFDGDGHWNICFDYRKNKSEPEITYIDTELDFERKIAQTFKEYLTLLEINADNEFVIETKNSITETIQIISNSAKIKFNTPDRNSHGYPIYSTKFEENQVWLSPNKVPAGFIRKDEKRYNELKHEMEKEALRFPEFDENFLLLTSHDSKNLNNLIEIIENQGLTVKEISHYFEK